MTGMLWQDFSKQPLCAKIEAAAAYYRAKYHDEPTVALVSKQDLDAAPIGVVSVVVLADAYVSPNYMIVGRMTE